METDVLSEARPSLSPVDVVFATAVLSRTRLLAVFYWARSNGHNRPLILLDFAVEPLDDMSWRRVKVRLDDLNLERRARAGRPLGLWIEGESLAQQASGAGIQARPIPAHLLKPAVWHSICQSTSAFLVRGEVAQTSLAVAAMARRPFLDAAGVYVGPRPDDPTVAAFLFGIVIALDQTLARDPKPTPPKRASRN